MKKANIISLVIFLSVLGYFFYSNHSANTATVVITDQGFSPEKITVQKGTTVTWVNKGERLHWPASNFHPLHNFYPEAGGCIGSSFDTCRGLAKGEAFSFKLDKVGIWPVHDHLFPGLTMMVEVTADGPAMAGQKAGVVNENVSAKDFKTLSYADQLDFIKTSAEKNPASAWEFLKKSFIINGQVMGNAHEFSHIIGNNLYEKKGLKGIKVCDTSFAFGCMHGVTEKMLLKEGVKKIKSIEEQCLLFFPPAQTQDFTGCIHGTGHGLFSFEGGDIKRALLDCDVMGEPYRPYCYDGVFMENSSTGENNLFDSKNPWQFCSDLNERYHRSCARYQLEIFLKNLGGWASLTVVGKNCSLGPSLLMRETCYEGLGYRTAQNSVGDPKYIFENCQKMPNKEGMEICATGGAIESIFQKYNDYKSSSNKLCSTLSEPRKTLCFNRIKIMIN